MFGVGSGGVLESLSITGGHDELNPDDRRSSGMFWKLRDTVFVTGCEDDDGDEDPTLAVFSGLH